MTERERTSPNDLALEAANRLTESLRQADCPVEALEEALSSTWEQIGEAIDWRRQQEEYEKELEVAEKQIPHEEVRALLQKQYADFDNLPHSRPKWEEVEEWIESGQLEEIGALFVPKIFTVDPINCKVSVTDGISEMPPHLARTYSKAREEANSSGGRLMTPDEFFWEFNTEDEYDTKREIWLESEADTSVTRFINTDMGQTCAPGYVAVGTTWGGRRGNGSIITRCAVDQKLPYRTVIDIQKPGVRSATEKIRRHLLYFLGGFISQGRAA